MRKETTCQCVLLSNLMALQKAKKKQKKTTNVEEVGNRLRSVKKRKREGKGRQNLITFFVAVAVVTVKPLCVILAKRILFHGN